VSCVYSTATDTPPLLALPLHLVQHSSRATIDELLAEPSLIPRGAASAELKADLILDMDCRCRQEDSPRSGPSTPSSLLAPLRGVQTVFLSIHIEELDLVILKALKVEEDSAASTYLVRLSSIGTLAHLERPLSPPHSRPQTPNQASETLLVLKMYDHPQYSATSRLDCAYKEADAYKHLKSLQASTVPACYGLYKVDSGTGTPCFGLLLEYVDGQSLVQYVQEKAKVQKYG
jgi:hypothetical protein